MAVLLCGVKFVFCTMFRGLSTALGLGIGIPLIGHSTTQAPRERAVADYFVPRAEREGPLAFDMQCYQRAKQSADECPLRVCTRATGVAPLASVVHWYAV